MAKYKVTYGLKGNYFEEEILEFSSDKEAWEYAKNQALEYVGYSAERIDPLTEDEIHSMEIKAIGILLDLPEERRLSLLKFVQNKSDS